MESTETSSVGLLGIQKRRHKIPRITGGPETTATSTPLTRDVAVHLGGEEPLGTDRGQLEHAV